MSIVDFELLLSRNVFGPREAARAGDLWRLCQDAALLGSSARGWDPARYSREGVAFVLRRMTAIHKRQVSFGDPVKGQTWVSSFRRGMFSNRQIRMEVNGERVTEATQEWIHVSQPDLKITRAPDSLLADFVVLDREPDVRFPDYLPATGPENHIEFDAWYTWMDPLDHANHPLYVDWCDEGLNRLLAVHDVDPHAMIAVAETVDWKSGIVAPERVHVTSKLVGTTLDGDAAFEHRVTGGDGRLCAVAKTIRGTVHADSLATLLGAIPV